MACAEACPADAIKQWGREISVEEAMAEIRRDRGYYERSGGGVTVSGGEPLLQADFVAALFSACREEDIHTCCESALTVGWGEIEKLLPVTDLWIADIKHMDPARHHDLCGVGNQQILENLRRLTEARKDLIIRIPVIPNVNDDEENIRRTADFILQELGGRIQVLQLLSFMRLGEEKYQSLGLPYRMKDVTVEREAFQKHVAEIAEYFNSRGIHCLVGTQEKE